MTGELERSSFHIMRISLFVGQDFDQVAELISQIGGIEGGGFDFGADKFEKALAEAVNGDVESVRVHGEFLASFGERAGSAAIEPSLQDLELTLFAGG